MLSVSAIAVNHPGRGHLSRRLGPIDLSGAKWPISARRGLRDWNDGKYPRRKIRDRSGRPPPDIPFRGVIFDVDPVFNNTEEWWLAIPEEIRPTKDQPYYHLFAENDESEYIAYVSEQNLVADDSGRPLRHPQIKEFFAARNGDVYVARDLGMN